MSWYADGYCIVYLCTMAVTVQVSLDTKDIQQLVSKLDAGKAAMGIARGLNDAVRQGRTESLRQVRKRYNLPLFEARKPGMIRVHAARKGDLTADVTANVKRSIPLTAFRGTTGDMQTVRRKRITRSKKIDTKLKRGGKMFSNVTRSRPRKKVSVEVIKGKRVTLDKAFLAKMPSGHVGVFARSFNARGYGASGLFKYRKKRIRTGKDEPDTPIAQLSSFTLHKAMANKHVEPEVIKKMTSAVPRRVEFWLKRNLGVV